MSENKVRLDYGYCTAQALGPGNGGLGDEAVKVMRDKTAKVHQSLAEGRKAKKLGFWELPFMTEDELEPILAEADRLRSFCDTLVVLGIGGSALGATAIDMGLAGSFRHAFNRDVGKMRLLVADNSDPRMFAGLMENLDLKRTAFNVVSKSGSTAETMSQYMVAKEVLTMALGEEEAARRIVFTTDPEKGNLRLIAGSEPIPCLNVPPNVGGRYSVFSAVGLLPLACAGHDIAALLKGAADMAKRASEPELMKNPSYLFAHLASHFFNRGRNILVMMPYASDLFGLSQWFAQLWAESLGKAKSVSGEEINTGQTPVAAVGATDQHSQLQLYMEGPKDKLTCFVTVEDYGAKAPIPEMHQDIDSINYLGGKTMEQLIQAEARATQTALAEQGRPSMNIVMPRIDEYCLGQVIFLLEAATVATGVLFEVDPLDQPGVELGKVLTYGLMGRKGFEEEAERMAKADIPGQYLV